jgi:hypothetical protein
MSVVTVTIAEAQFSQTGAGNLRAMHVIGSTDISESKQNYPRNNAKARRNVPSVEFNPLTGRRRSDCRGANRQMTTIPCIPGSDTEVGPRAFVLWPLESGREQDLCYLPERERASFV